MKGKETKKAWHSILGAVTVGGGNATASFVTSTPIGCNWEEA